MMIRHSLLRQAVLTLSLFAAAQAAQILRVPEDKPTLQAAIDAAADGDTILVAPGTYNEPVKIAGKSVTLASRFLTSGDRADIAATILDGKGRSKDAGAVVTVDKTVGPKTRIMGFTIQNGGHGVINYGRVEVLDNHFIGNGDALSFESGAGLVRGNTFERNSDDGIDMDGASEAIIEDNVMRNNRDDGIEIRLHTYSGPTLNIEIRRNEFSGNGEDGLQLIDYPGKSDRIITVERNRFLHNAMAAIGSMKDGNTKENYEGTDLPEPVFILNNTFVGGPYGVTGGDNMVLVNNLFSGLSQIALKRVHGDSAASHNLLWNNGADFVGCDLATDTFITADPRLDESHQTRSGSPVFDAGIAVFDYNGLTLKIAPDSYKGFAPDIGAGEVSGR